MRMYGIRTAIIADSSAVGRQLTEHLLRAHCPVVIAAADAESALAAVREATGPTLLIADVALDGAGGLELIERCAERVADRPSFVVTTVSPSVEEETRATLLGAIGYLKKPISYRDIASLLRGQQIEFGRSAPRARAHPLTRAEAWDRDKYPQLWWDVNDLSVTGAFLVTRAPLPLGTLLELRVLLGADGVHVSAEVVRLQQPSWAHVGGVGVHFRNIESSSYEKLERFIEAALRGHR